MKEIKKEVVTTVVEGYEAMDGTVFTNKDECIKYEGSAVGILKARMGKFVVNQGPQSEIMRCGCYDDTLYVCKPKSDADIDTMKQLYCLINGGKDATLAMLDDQVGKVVLFTICYDNDCAWVDTLESLTERMLKAD